MDEQELSYLCRLCAFGRVQPRFRGTAREETPAALRNHVLRDGLVGDVLAELSPTIALPAEGGFPHHGQGRLELARLTRALSPSAAGQLYILPRIDRTYEWQQTRLIILLSLALASAASKSRAILHGHRSASRSLISAIITCSSHCSTRL